MFTVAHHQPDSEANTASALLLLPLVGRVPKRKMVVVLAR